MYNAYNTPATPLNNAHLAGFLFGGLKRTDSNNISKDCFGIDEKILSSWIHTLVYIRNLCAHHSRIWNRTLAPYTYCPHLYVIYYNLNLITDIK